METYSANFIVKNTFAGWDRHIVVIITDSCWSHCSCHCLLALGFSSRRLNLRCLLEPGNHPCFEYCLFVVDRGCCTCLESFIADTFIKVASWAYFNIVVVRWYNLTINQLIKHRQLPNLIIMVFIVTIWVV